LADEVGGSFGGLISSVGLALDQIKEGTEKTAKGITEAIGPVLAGKIGGSLGQMVSGAKKSFASLGASIGNAIAMIPGIGTVKFGEVSESTAKKIAEADKTMSGFTAVSKYFGDVIRDVGVTQENVNDLWSRASQIVGHWKKGYLSASDATRALNDSFSELLKGTQELGEEGSAAMVKFILKVRNSGLEVQAVTDYVIGQLDRIPSALTSLVESYDEAGMSAQEMGDIAVHTFNAMLASGVSWTDTVSKMSEPLSALKDKYKELGITADPAIEKLFKIVGVTEENKELFKAIDANKEIMEALGNSGWMTGDILNSFAEEAINNYEKLKEKFGNSDEALRAMGPTLQKIQDYAAAYNITLDEGTQSLIDQAAQIGVVKKTQEDSVEVQKRLFKELGQEIGRHMKEAADSIGKSIKEAFGDAFKEAENRAKIAGDNIRDKISRIKPTIDIGFGADIKSLKNLNNQFPGIVTSFGNVKFAGGFQAGGVIEAGPYRPTAFVFGEGPTRERAVIERVGNRFKSSGDYGKIVMHNQLTINTQRLDDRTIDEAADKLFAAIDRQARRRGGKL